MNRVILLHKVRRSFLLAWFMSFLPAAGFFIYGLPMIAGLLALPFGAICGFNAYRLSKAGL